MSLHNTIIVKGAGQMLGHEFKAGEAGIYPGHLLEESAAGTCLRANRASTVGAPQLVAVENPYLTGGLKSTVYANGDTVYARAVTPGSEFQARVAAAAVAIAINDSLVSDGDGGYKKAAAADEVHAVALEAVDNSGGGSSTLILVRAR